MSEKRGSGIRKIVFIVAVAVFLCAGYCLLDELWFQPQRAQAVTHTLQELYTGEVSDADVSSETVMPEDIDASFVPLYLRNPDVRGWLTFTADGGGKTADLFGGMIDNPVVQAADNDYYLNRNYLKEKDKAGTLFMDYRNDSAALATERNTVIYGHNLRSGLMFSKFNTLIGGDVGRARRLTTVTFDPLYGERITYKVFAVMLIDAEATDSAAFDYIRTEFADDDDFAYFVENIRMRSLYEFGDVDVSGTDTILTLSTCSSKRSAALANGRTVIVARRLREGESAEVNTALTTLNENVLMPKAWYINKGLDLPEAYTYG